MVESPGLRAQQQALERALPAPISISVSPDIQGRVASAFELSLSTEIQAIQRQAEQRIEALNGSLETQVAKLQEIVSVGENKIKTLLEAIANTQRRSDKILSDTQRIVSESREAIEFRTIVPNSALKLLVTNADLRSDGYIYLVVSSQRLYDIDHVQVRLETSRQCLELGELWCGSEAGWSTVVPAMAQSVTAAVKGEGVVRKQKYQVALLVNRKFVSKRFQVMF